MNKLPVGLQVYGLRDLLEATPERFREVMIQVRKLGYDGVELAGTYGIAPEEIRNILCDADLIPISAHVPLIDMMRDAQAIANVYKTIGCKYIVVPYLPEEYRHHTPGYARVLVEMERIGKIMVNNGLALMYHNHDFEFVTLEDQTFGLDDIYAKVPRQYLMAEPDTCWIQVAGQDAAAYVRKYKGRCPIVHLKDYIKVGNPCGMYKLIGMEAEEVKEDNAFFEFRPVGFGQQIWVPILDAACDADAEWVVVEQDEHYDLSSLECARRSREYLRILGW